MKFPRITIFICVVVLAAGSVAAEEILYLMNGTTMPIKSHKVIDGMIHCDLGEDGRIAFPERNVERIEKAGREVYLGPSLKLNTTKADGSGVVIKSSRDENTAYPAFGSTSGDSRRSSINRREKLNEQAKQKDFTRDEAGIAVVTPAQRSPNAVIRGMRSSGRLENRKTRSSSRNNTSRIYQPDSQTNSLGTKEVIGTIKPPRGSKSNPVEVRGLTLKDGTPPNTTNGSGSSEGSTGSGNSDSSTSGSGENGAN